jgi:hypothetical protein
VAAPGRSRAALSRLARLGGFADRQVVVVSAVALYALVLLAVMPQMLVQDSWLSFVSGREIVMNGLPHADTLTVWTSGVPWTDQQWLAHVAFYGLISAGGVELALLLHVALLTGAFAAALAASRSLGASAKSAALIGLICMFVAPWSLQLRSQSFAIPLFVALLWLLAADSRTPSRRVLLVLPLLVLWANLHGTVVLAAFLVALRGVTLAFAALRGRHRPPGWLGRSLALGVLPFASLFASPYGLALGDYYRTMLVSPLLRDFVGEWAASRPSVKTLAFYLVGTGAVGLLLRYRSRLTGFEQLALLALLVAGASAIRSIVWFALAAAVLLPLLLDGLFSQRPRRRDASRLRRAVAVAAVAAVAVSLGVAAARPASWWITGWPTEGAAHVAKLVEERPGAKVFADDRYADWLVWEQPQLAGRIAYDVRFELLTREQLDELVAYRGRVGDDWLRAFDDYEVLLVDHPLQPSLVRELTATGRFERSYRDRWLTVLTTPRR